MSRDNGHRNFKPTSTRPGKPMNTGRSSKRAAALENKTPTIPPRLRRVTKDTVSTVITYVLDTNVLMSDWRALFNFKEHRVLLVGTVYRELDAAKKRMDVVGWNVRKVTGAVDEIISKSSPEELVTGVPLIPPEEVVTENGPGTLVLDFSKPKMPEGLSTELDQSSADDRILMMCLAHQKNGETVVLVSDDSNLRTWAATVGVKAEPYLYHTKSRIVGEEDQRTGFHVLTDDFWETHIGEPIVKREEGGGSVYNLHHPVFTEVYPNEFIILPDGKHLVVTEVGAGKKENTVVAKTLKNFNRHPVFGVTPRNPEQGFALHLLTNPDITGVLLAGKAGSGKTFLAVSAALAQVLDTKRYRNILFTRTLVGADREIGFLPGTEEEKMKPWARPFYDNLRVLLQGENGADNDKWESTMQLLRNKIEIVSMNTLQGSTFSDTFIIVDEAQNLTREGLKMIMTRVGVGSKFVLLGNVAQIFNPFLTEETNGVSLYIRKFSDLSYTGHVTLQRGERSDLATVAEDRL